jgi:hypothetical protein
MFTIMSSSGRLRSAIFTISAASSFTAEIPYRKSRPTCAERPRTSMKNCPLPARSTISSPFAPAGSSATPTPPSFVTRAASS